VKRIENIIIDVKNKQYDEIKLKQMDTTQLVFNLYDNSQEIVLVDLTADVVFTKPNGTIVIQNAVVDATEKTVTVDLLADCVRDYGKGSIEVELKQDDEVLSSFQMDVKIEKTSKENIHSDNTPNYIESMELAVSELRTQGEEILEEYENLVAEVQTILSNITNRGHIYGIKRKITDLNGNVNNTSTAWTKIYDNVGLVAEAQKGSDSNVRNDYDNLYPWNSIISLNYDTTNKKVDAYYGDADFKFDGSNGEVLTRFPKMWIKRLFPIQEEDGFYEYRLIADFELQDFIQIDQFEMGRYKISTDSNNVAHSYSGAVPKYNANIVNFSTYAANLGNEFCLEDWRRFVVETLYLVEYADNNSQSKLGNGIQSYSKATSLLAESSVNRIIVSSAPTGLWVGKTICIGTSAEWNSAVAANREITSIETYSDGTVSGYAIYFDGDPVNIAVGNVIWGSAQKTGECDSLGMKSGCLNNNGYHSVIYRGLEDILAHMFEFIVGLNIKDYQTFVNYKPSSYAPNVFDGDYESLSFANPNNEEGYIKVMGYDKHNPLIALPTVLGASSSTGYADYCYSKNDGNRVALVGGGFNVGAVGGLFYWYFNYSSSSSYWSIGARLLKYQ
jgi:hypothetical protein